MNPNQPESRGGLPGALRAIGVIAVIVVALVGIGVVLDVIPREALEGWMTKIGLALLIVVGAAVALALLMRRS